MDDTDYGTDFSNDYTTYTGGDYGGTTDFNSALDSALQQEISNQGGPTQDIGATTFEGMGGGGGGGTGYEQLLQMLGMGGGGSKVGGQNPLLASLLGLTGGALGMSQAHSLQDLARGAMSGANPFGPFRAQYGGMLSDIMANPSKVTSLPGYQFGLTTGEQSVGRTMAGTSPGGNEEIALQKFGSDYATNYLTKYEDLLSGLAGANITPNYGPGLSAFSAGTGVESSALNSLGAGAQSFFGGTGQPGGGGNNIAALIQMLAGGGGGGGVAQPSLNPNAAGGEATALGEARQLVGYGKDITGITGTSGTDYGQGLSDLGAGLSVIAGLQHGGFTGYTSAALNTGRLVENLAPGVLPEGVGEALGPLGAAFGLYTGLKKGGVTGYGSAALDAYQLYTDAMSAFGGGSAAAGAGATGAAGAGATGAAGAEAGTAAASGAGEASAAAGAGSFAYAAAPIAVALYGASTQPYTLTQDWWNRFRTSLTKGTSGNATYDQYDSPALQEWNAKRGLYLKLLAGPTKNDFGQSGQGIPPDILAMARQWGMISPSGQINKGWTPGPIPGFSTPANGAVHTGYGGGQRGGRGVAPV